LRSNAVPRTISIRNFDVVHCKRVRVYTKRPRSIVSPIRCLRSIKCERDCVRLVR
jgi:hypothetical protein